MNKIVLSRRTRVGKRTKKRGQAAEGIWHSRLYDEVWSAVTESIVYDRPSVANRDVSKVVELLGRVSDFSESTVVSVLREAEIDPSLEILAQIAATLVESLSTSATMPGFGDGLALKAGRQSGRVISRPAIAG